MTTVFTLADCQKHTGRDDCWLIIDGKVYDVSQFMDEHPGGDEVIISAAGKDATEDFEDVGHSDDARELIQKYQIGDMDVSTLPLKQSHHDAPRILNGTSTAERNPSEMLIKVLQFLIPLTILALALAMRYLSSDTKSIAN